ncbi:unnamed protein product [Ceratitis capitata]|uniref:(Mediterranean fruit fly) hypothetical protein n=1 Tax=Ceratitis capitata TaxID=7213 RepID=A0A811UUD1_CERCA|nr:unnamed protein product [Ceratitis capitata]
MHGHLAFDTRIGLRRFTFLYQADLNIAGRSACGGSRSKLKQALAMTDTPNIVEDHQNRVGIMLPYETMILITDGSFPMIRSF